MSRLARAARLSLAPDADAVLLLLRTLELLDRFMFVEFKGQNQQLALRNDIRAALIPRAAAPEDQPPRTKE